MSRSSWTGLRRYWPLTDLDDIENEFLTRSISNMNPKRVILFGVGSIGSRVMGYLVERGGYEIVGAVDSDPAKLGVDVGEVAGLKKSLGVCIAADPRSLFERVKADVVVLTTQSSLERVQSQILEIVSQGMDIVSTCEELAYPWLTAPDMAQEIDRAAKEHGVSVLGTGVNPGFAMDLLPLVLTGVCQEVRKVTVRRTMDAQVRRLPFQKKIGVGLSLEAFRQRVAEGTLRHVGLTESMHMIASTMEWKLDRIEENIDPVIAEEQVVTEAMTVERGQVLGVHQTGRGYMNEEEVIRLVLRAAVGEQEPQDRVLIEGTPDLDMCVAGGIHGDIATAAIVVNAIPVAIRSAPGLVTMVDVEPVTYYDQR
jgi:4-hydroxy-tetrahydrodipicolinate reductase